MASKSGVLLGTSLLQWPVPKDPREMDVHSQEGMKILPLGLSFYGVESPRRLSPPPVDRMAKSYTKKSPEPAILSSQFPSVYVWTCIWCRTVELKVSSLSKMIGVGVGCLWDFFPFKYSCRNAVWCLILVFHTPYTAGFFFFSYFFFVLLVS